MSTGSAAILAGGRAPGVEAVTAPGGAALDDAVLAPLDPDGTLLCNVNTPADVDHARRHAEAHRGPVE